MYFFPFSVIVTVNLGLWNMYKSELNHLELGSTYLTEKIYNSGEYLIKAYFSTMSDLEGGYPSMI